MKSMKELGLGFHHVALSAVDFDKTCDFYITGLGMKYYTGWKSGDVSVAMLDMGDGEILEIFSGGEACCKTVDRYIHLALRTESVDDAYNAALNYGAVSKAAPCDVELESSPVKLKIRCGFVYGPSGEEIEFFKVLEQR